MRAIRDTSFGATSRSEACPSPGWMRQMGDRGEGALQRPREARRLEIGALNRWRRPTRRRLGEVRRRSALLKGRLGRHAGIW
jgi:hypothetical protein